MTRGAESFQERREGTESKRWEAKPPPTSSHPSPSHSPGDPGPAPVPLGWWESKDIWLGLIDEGGGSHRALRLLFAEHTDSSPLTSCRPPRLLSLTATTSSGALELEGAGAPASREEGEPGPQMFQYPMGTRGSLGLAP